MGKQNDARMRATVVAAVVVALIGGCINAKEFPIKAANAMTPGGEPGLLGEVSVDVTFPSGDSHVLVGASANGAPFDFSVTLPAGDVSAYLGMNAYERSNGILVWSVSYLGPAMSGGPFTLHLERPDYVVVLAVRVATPTDLRITVESASETPELTILASGDAIISTYHAWAVDALTTTTFDHGVDVTDSSVEVGSASAGDLKVRSKHGLDEPALTFSYQLLYMRAGVGVADVMWERYGSEDSASRLVASPARILNLVNTETGSGASSLMLRWQGAGALTLNHFDHLSIPFDGAALGLTVESLTLMPTGPLVYEISVGASCFSRVSAFVGSCA